MFGWYASLHDQGENLLLFRASSKSYVSTYMPGITDWYGTE